MKPLARRQTHGNKRKPMQDSSAQLELLGVRPIDGNTFEGSGFRVERTTDPDYPWLLKRLDCGYCDGTKEVAESSTRYMRCPRCTDQRLASLIEAVQVIQKEMEGPNGSL